MEESREERGVLHGKEQIAIKKKNKNKNMI